MQRKAKHSNLGISTYLNNLNWENIILPTQGIRALWWGKSIKIYQQQLHHPINPSTDMCSWENGFPFIGDEMIYQNWLDKLYSHFG